MLCNTTTKRVEVPMSFGSLKMTSIARVLLAWLVLHCVATTVAQESVTPDVDEESRPKLVRADSGRKLPLGKWEVIPGDGNQLLETTIRTNGGPLFVLAKIGGMNITWGQLVRTRLIVDGAVRSQEPLWHGLGSSGERKLGVLQNSVLCAVVDNLDAGEHIIKVEWYRERGEADVDVSTEPAGYGPVASRELIAMEIANALTVSRLQNDVKVKFGEAVAELKKLESQLGKLSNDARTTLKDELRREIAAEIRVELRKEIIAEIKADPDFKKGIAAD